MEPQLGPYLINEGTLEILPDGYGFLRSVNYNYKASPDDIYISPSQIKRFRLRQGDSVIGIIRPPKVGERYFALLRVEGVNGHIPRDVDNRGYFDELLPVHPEHRYFLEYVPNEYTTRLIDMFAPIGKGQRSLIVAQPKTGKTTILRNIANAVSQNHPEAKILILLVDERPEEVTEMERCVEGQKWLPLLLMRNLKITLAYRKLYSKKPNDWLRVGMMCYFYWIQLQDWLEHTMYARGIEDGP